jgi:hypothetical protein
VLALCSKISDAPNFKTAESAAEKKKFGFVYLLKSGRYYKIGRSNASARREYELAIQLPERPRLVHQIRTDDPVGIEEYWHKRFTDKHKNGEWLELSVAELRSFTRRKCKSRRRDSVSNRQRPQPAECLSEVALD